MKNIHYIYLEYQKWHIKWDEICNRCGQCCYTRYINHSGKVIVDYANPCEFLDENSGLCKVFENRFEKCKNCGKVNLARALFYPLMPEDCAYVNTFRTWRK